MSVTTIITIVLVYAAFRAAIRPRKPDPMAGRLVPRTHPVDVRGSAELMQDIRARADDLRGVSMFESPDQMRRGERAFSAAGSASPEVQAWFDEQDRLSKL
jgi:hypothetical protein